MEDKNRQYAAAGFVIGLIGGLALVALVIGAYVIMQRGSAPRSGRIGQRVAAPVSEPVMPTQLAVAEVLVYEPFDGDEKATDEGVPLDRELQPGQFGLAVRLPIDKPLVYRVPGAAFLREATVMGWVRIDNQRDRSLIWAYSRCYPSAFYYPDHQYKLAMHFIDNNPAVLSSTLAQAMQPGRYYHIAQTWGPGGFRTYLDGVPVLQDTLNRQGMIANPQFTDDDAFYLGSHPGSTGNESGPGYQMNHDGILVDDFALFSRQLRADEVAGVAQSGVPLGDMLQ